MRKAQRISIECCLLILVVWVASAGVALGAGNSSRTVVAIVEPSVTVSNKHEPSYSISIGGAKVFGGLELLNALAKADGTRLVMLVHESVPLGVTWGIAASASKAGYLQYAVYVFDKGRTAMAQISDFKSTKFTSSPEALDK
jgi:hypothetical protein